MSKQDTIAQALDLEPLKQAEAILEPKAPDYKDDFEYARGNMINILEKGNEALTGILDVANMSQHPRSFEVVATIIKTLADTNKDLLELSQKKKKLDEVDGTSKPTTVNNNLFVGSTAELQKLLKQNDEQAE